MNSPHTHTLKKRTEQNHLVLANCTHTNTKPRDASSRRHRLPAEGSRAVHARTHAHTSSTRAEGLPPPSPVPFCVSRESARALGKLHPSKLTNDDIITSTGDGDTASTAALRCEHHPSILVSHLFRPFDRPVPVPVPRRSAAALCSCKFYDLGDAPNAN